MYAIIKSGGKQYKVSEGDELFLEKLEAEEGKSLKFEQVLALGEGDSLKVGSPFLEGACVEAEVLKHGRGKKIRIFKYKAKKGYRRRKGHRQPYTLVKISSVKGA